MGLAQHELPIRRARTEFVQVAPWRGDEIRRKSGGLPCRAVGCAEIGGGRRSAGVSYLTPAAVVALVIAVVVVVLAAVAHLLI